MTRTSSTVYTYSYTVPAGNGTGTITLSNGTDVAGNTLTTPTSNNTFTVDNTAPTGDLTFGSDGPYKQGDTVNIFVTFSEDMADTPTPQITITGANGSGISTTTITMILDRLLEITALTIQFHLEMETALSRLQMELIWQGTQLLLLHNKTPLSLLIIHHLR